DGRHIASGSGDRTIRIWDAQTGQPVGTPLEGHASWVYSVAYSPDGTHIASGSHDQNMRIWEVQPNMPHTNQLYHSHLVKLSPRLNHSLCNPHNLNALHNGSDIQLSITSDGWIVDSACSPPALVMWLPPHNRNLYTPSTNHIIGAHTEVDLSDFAHGPDWTKCMK
ncbi:WD40 repeat-like protein, partial [Auriscalpium vulgare]